MKSFKQFVQEIDAICEDTDTAYRGEHESPGPGSGSPLHNLKGTYDDDFYGPQGVRMYGDGATYDHESHAAIARVRNRPNATLKVYRAVPHEPTHAEKLNAAYDAQRHYMKTGKLKNIGHGVDNYDKLHAHIEHLEKNPPKEGSEPPKAKINPGDWVSVSKTYAHEHGRDNLKGKYKVLSKTVRASEVWTDGNSIHEQGYHPNKK
jgi:hypothetical protein